MKECALMRWSGEGGRGDTVAFGGCKMRTMERYDDVIVVGRR